jgi:hypothetical protein
MGRIDQSKRGHAVTLGANPRTETIMSSPARRNLVLWPAMERAIDGHDFLDQELFAAMIRREQRRSERSCRRFILMLLESHELLRSEQAAQNLPKILYALSDATRETDIKGWYKDKSVLGVIFTEVGNAEGRSITHSLLTKMTGSLSAFLGIDHATSVMLSFHIFPEPSAEHGLPRPLDSAFYPERDSLEPKRVVRQVKRGLDVAAASSS